MDTGSIVMMVGPRIRVSVRNWTGLQERRRTQQGGLLIVIAGRQRRCFRERRVRTQQKGILIVVTARLDV